MTLRRLVLSFALLLPAISSHGAIRGTIMSLEGVPLPDVRVAAFALESSSERLARLVSTARDRAVLAETVTDAKGNFTLEVKEHPVVTIMTQKNGFAPAAMLIASDDDAGAIALRPALAKQGRVLAGSESVAGAAVIFSGFDGSELIGRTGEHGSFEVSDPSTWANAVLIIHPDHPITSESIGSRSKLEYRLRKGVTVRGSVTGQDGNPIVARFIARDGIPLGVSREDGGFALSNVPYDWKEIDVVADGLIATLTPGSSDAIRLRAGSTLRGTLVNARSQRPVAGARIILREGSTSFGGGRSLAETITDARGRYSITPLLPGTFAIDIDHPDLAVSRSTVALTRGETIDKLLQGAPTARISGTVMSESKKPIAAALVSFAIQGARPGAPMSRRRASALSAPDGRFTVRGIEGEGQIELSAFRKGLPAGKNGPIALAGGERRSGVTIVIPHGLEITGRVSDRNGVAIMGATVTPAESGEPRTMMIALGRSRDESDSQIVKTARDGSFAIRLKEGKYDFRVRAEGYVTRMVRGVAVHPGVEPVEVTMTEGVSIAGRLLRSDGSGVAGAMVMVVGEQNNETTEADGSFVLSDLEPGVKTIAVNKFDEMISEMKTATAPASDLVIRLAAGGRITGRVSSSSTGEAITDFQAGLSNAPSAGPGIRIMGPPMTRSFHPEDGRFILENVRFGTHELTVSAPGHVTYRLPGVKLDEENPSVEVEIELETGVRLAGRVTGTDGLPLSGVTVQADAEESDAGPMRGFGRRAPAISTDANGDYVLEGIEPGERSFTFAKSGFIPEHKSVRLSGREARLDVRLSKGQQVRGLVVTDTGAPVAGARVSAESSAKGAGFTSATTDEGGVFSFDGLPPGRYNFRGMKSGLTNGQLEDVDIATSGNLRIVLGSGGIISGRVTGLSESELSNAMVSAQGERGSSGAPLDSTGRFRIEGAPTGTVRVSASTMGFGGRKSSQAKTVDVTSGSEVHVDIEFQSDTVVRGRVTRVGTIVDSALVNFFPDGPAPQTRAIGRTDQDGYYEVSGLQDGKYRVVVSAPMTSVLFETTYSVSGSGQFDIDIPSSGLRGRVVDAESGEPIAGATVTVQRARQSGGVFFTPGAVSDLGGNFRVDSLASGTYQVRAEKDKYGQQILDATLGEGGISQELQFRLYKTDGLTFRVVDARDGRTLEAHFVITDMQGRTAHNGFLRSRPDGSTRVQVAAGSYRATIAASGYAPATVTVTAPSPEIRIGITPGGTLLVVSRSGDRRRARIVSASGDEQRPSIWSPSGDYTINPGSNRFEHLAPGVYSLILLDDAGNPDRTTPVTITEGRTTEVEV
ncbi:MAG TPA: carboxypeptidase regulatory-like domain-containing protein [Thermoanaerobaculia bacterium]|nr:carboxypeptidase regulatory-like domain-containing protein [Thermoanaerobaculia bacterium]